MLVITKVGTLKAILKKNRRQLVFELKEINDRCRAITISSDGVRPHRGDKRSSGVSELGRLMFASARKSYTVTTSHAPKLIDFNGYRKLTPVECERLQTLPDNYTASVSNSQRYKMIGNGWTVDVIAHILRGLKEKEI